MTLGLVCDSCDALNPLNATACQSCNASLGIVKGKSAPNMADATGVVKCASCAMDVPGTFRFCPSCGAKVTDAAAPAPATQAPELREQGGRARTMFFGAMQAARAKLILIKGEGMDGVSYVLSATEHLAGRLEGQIIFPEDPLLSPRHANFLYRDGKLFVRDEGSANGVFVRIVRPHALQPGGLFLVGEQLLRVEAVPAEAHPVPDSEGTYFYASPRRPARFGLVNMIAGGYAGMVYRTREDTVTMGREGNDVNFPDDPFISGRHAQVTVLDTPQGPRFTLTDLGSKNGTFVRVHDEAPLVHGDYVFIGQQLLRVEIT
jgi:pSer/pThr/pTyr-binding forkhead associated (FHA) protein